MKRTLFPATLVTVVALVSLAALLALPATTSAEALSVSTDDTVTSLLAARSGQRVTLKLHSGEELTGTVTQVTETLVHLGGLSGREFFDAAVATQAIDALIVRTRDR